MNKIVNFGMTLPHQVLEKMDEVRGDIPRTKYILRLVEKALKEQRLNQYSVLPPTEQEEGGVTPQK